MLKMTYIAKGAGHTEPERRSI